MMKHMKVMPLAAVISAVMSAQSVAGELDPAHVDLGGGVKMTPKLELKQTRNDNIYLTSDNEVYSGITTAKPSVSVWAEKGNSKYNVDFSLNGISYNNAHNNDSLDWELAAGVKQEFNSRNRLDLNLSAGTYTEYRTFAEQEEIPEYDGAKADVTYGFGAKSAKLNFDIYGRYNSKDYNEDAESKDATSSSVGGIVYFGVAPKTKALLELRKSTMEYDNVEGSDFDLDTTLVGVTWESTAKTTGFVKVGIQDQDRDAGDSSDSEAWEVGVTWEPQTYSVFQLSTDRGYELETRSGEFSEYAKVGLSWLHAWTVKWETNLSIGYTDEDLNDEFGVLQVSRETSDASAVVSFLSSRWSKISAGVKSADRTAEEGARAVNSTDEYKRTEIFVGVELSM